ncbi:uncharacterized protein N7483_002094 [Penicillium malachiteum]|uniref:uncharacterized protein n=1 Tax=Penicillium malachiteum TaxID=1324776 RepID=UPI002548ED3D|nr:uncharacterized protein N7483_002094 [Penicillium malachiteum]KAJ5736969.1 hypothetical protein N7483_002094 [Penicillium malachiteum]
MKEDVSTKVEDRVSKEEEEEEEVEDLEGVVEEGEEEEEENREIDYIYTLRVARKITHQRSHTRSRSPFESANGKQAI